MAKPEEQVKATVEAFEQLAENGRQWVGLDEVAVRAMRNHRDRKRWQRSRAANSLRDLLAFRGGIPTKPSSRFRRQTQLAAMSLEAEGKLEHRFIDGEGRLRKDPPIPRDYRDKRYRFLPAFEEKAVSPQDRFESIAKRVEALPMALTEGEGPDVMTTVSAQIGTPVNPTWPRPTTVDISLTYLPTREGAEETEPGSIAASWTTPTVGGGVRNREERLAASQLDGSRDTATALSMLEDTVRAVELNEASLHAQEELHRIMSSTFTAEPTPMPVRRYPDRQVM